MKASMAAIGGAALLLARLALAGPGDPFDADDTGCVPDAKEHLVCEVKLAKSVAKLIASVVRCHIEQAAAAFASKGFGEGGCEQSAQSKFDTAVTKLTGSGGCPQAALDGAAQEETVLLGGATQTDPPSLDVLNGSIFCDSSSGVPLAATAGDNDDDDQGWVSADAPGLKCAVAVAKNVYKLWAGVIVRCHARAAAAGFKGAPDDDEACETSPLYGVRTKYDKLAAKLVAANICPSCLDAGGQAALGDGVQQRADDENGLVFVCASP